jgi:hypothetical protein
MALGKLGDKDGIEFLVKHVALVVPPGGRIASDRTWPCFNALDAAGWSCVPAVLRHLEHERSELELALSTTFLRKTLGREAATTFVAEQARTSDDDSYRRNLRRVLEMIPTS